MPSMPATAGHSAACCNIPPVLSDGYEEKGSYIEELGGFKTYATGPDDAEKAILVVFDIFGYFPQTIQGADILSTSDDHQKYKVFMPDFFHGNPCPIEWYPPDTEQKMKDVGAWFGQHPPQGVADKLPALVKAIEAKYPSIKSWGIIGYCFGGKVTSIITASDSNPFKIAAEAHPAMVDPEEADKIRVPLIMLASKDEPADKVKEFEDKLKVAKHVEIFGDQIHGWMAARSDLKDPRVKEEYVRGYETVLSFFGKNWA
ncbi:alpha/beta-hydrolase [Thozetella sp. PMI_491]|nr:alpha/beta-hydrolase [Thozetella sp. PMI_491]